MRLIVLSILLALVLVACDVDTDSAGSQPPTPVVVTSTPTSEGDDSAQRTPIPTSTVAATATVDGTGGTEPTPTEQSDPSGGESQPETVAEIEAIEADVVQLRELELVEDLNEEVIDRAELESRVEDLIEYSPEEASDDALAYWLLRLIDDRNIDLYQLQIDLLGEQIAGYYNPETDDLVVVTQSGDLTAIDKVTMAHEIVHALQDQHFDLVAIDDLATDHDRDMAITALVEGDASFSMGQYMLNYLDPLDLLEILGDSVLGPQNFDVLENAPRYIADQLVFPYEGGQAFVTAIHSEGGFDALNAAFDAPPASSEQVLHPEKYIGPERDEPIAVENPDLLPALGEGWELVTGDVLGEWDLRIMLEESGVDAAQASTAAAGWGGSWYDVYQSGDDGLALLTTRWDSEDEAAEFSEAIGQSFSSMQDDGGLMTDGERYFVSQVSGDTVVIVTGTDRAAVEAAVNEVGQTS